ncbi:hypothetical protein DFH11DRAFT_1786016 [Phellopilus nigrolimitatus]|nr:hypothetical protein DFH11DRAFT_1786016 [Phellopilus nigrolimitatus]
MHAPFAPLGRSRLSHTRQTASLAPPPTPLIPAELSVPYRPTFDAQTLMMNSPFVCWLSTFLCIYIRVFLLVSDIDETVEEKLLIGYRPKVADMPENKIPLKMCMLERKEAEFNELIDYVLAGCGWLGLYQDHARPRPEVVLVEVSRQQETLRGNTAKANWSSSPPTIVRKGHAEVSSVVCDPPEGVPEIFDLIAVRSKEDYGKDGLPRKALHTATFMQEVALTLVLVSIRFKAATLKADKFGGMFARTPAEGERGPEGDGECTGEDRRDACRHIQRLCYYFLFHFLTWGYSAKQFEHDSLTDVAKRFENKCKHI